MLLNRAGFFHKVGKLTADIYLNTAFFGKVKAGSNICDDVAKFICKNPVVSPATESQKRWREQGATPASSTQ